MLGTRRADMMAPLCDMPFLRPCFAFRRQRRQQRDDRVPWPPRQHQRTDVPVQHLCPGWRLRDGRSGHGPVSHGDRSERRGFRFRPWQLLPLFDRWHLGVDHRPGRILLRAPRRRRQPVCSKHRRRRGPEGVLPRRGAESERRNLSLAIGVNRAAELLPRGNLRRDAPVLPAQPTRGRWNCVRGPGRRREHLPRRCLRRSLRSYRSGWLCRADVAQWAIHQVR